MIMSAIGTLIAETMTAKFSMVTKSYNTFIMLKSLDHYDRILLAVHMKLKQKQRGLWIYNVLSEIQAHFIHENLNIYVVYIWHYFCSCLSKILTVAHGGTKQNNRRPENNETFLTVTHAVLSIGLRAYRVKFDHSISFLKHQSIKQLG